MKKPVAFQFKVLRGLGIVCLSFISIPSFGQLECTVNDHCNGATLIPNVLSDAPFVCIEGCTNGATPEILDNACSVADFPAVWYRVETDGLATLINIFVTGDEIEHPTISLYLQINGCSNLQLVGQTSSNIECIYGSDFEAESLGSAIGGNNVYYILVGSHNSPGGKFELCVNTISQSSVCVVDRNIEITARSSGKPFNEPFLPSETISVCFNVNNYTAAGNGCQWFQGLVPVFGDGWDPSSFDANYQPLNATLNGAAMGVENNGNYGTSTWDWFSDVDYHYQNTFFQVGDFDGNGNVEMCNILYDPGCPNVGGINASCCGPCWGNPLGTILPNGWFAYGINGTCPTPGPPIRVDWGDGNSCGGGMGPWKFCFDLYVRDFPDCAGDAENRDLTMGFFTFADGETGSWTGSASVCALDQPAFLRPAFNCNGNIYLGIEHLPSLCAGDTFHYELYNADVTHWTWQIDPPDAFTNPVFEGDNGFIFNQETTTPTGENQQVTIYLTGTGFGNVFSKVIKFVIGTPVKIDMDDELIICEKDTNYNVINPSSISGGFPPYQYQWSNGVSSNSIILPPPAFEGTFSLTVTDEAGCTAEDAITVKLKPCHLGLDDPEDDDNNDDPIPKDSIDKGNFTDTNPGIAKRTSDFIQNNLLLKVWPIPSHDKLNIQYKGDEEGICKVELFDTKGVVIEIIRDQYVGGKIWTIDVSSIPTGIYVLRYSNEGRTWTQKVIIQ